MNKVTDDTTNVSKASMRREWENGCQRLPWGETLPEILPWLDSRVPSKAGGATKRKSGEK